MSKVHYCEQCGLSLGDFTFSRKRRVYLENYDISKCEECDPKTWRKMEDNKYFIINNRKLNSTKSHQWSKYQL